MKGVLFLIIFSVLLVIFGFNLIIFAHEAGHFIFAKLFGFRVDEFAIGFGKPIASLKYGETTYSFRLIPVGGFNKIPEIDSSYVDKPMSLAYYLKRLVVLGAGAGFNFASAFVATALLLSLAGVPQSSATIQDIHPEVSAHANLFKTGDIILSVNDIPYDKNTQQILSANYLNIKVNRNGEIIPIQFYKDAGQPIGITFQNEYTKISLDNLIPATTMAFESMIYVIVDSFSLLVNMPAHDVIKSTAGPVGISMAMFKAEQEMGIVGFVFLFSLLSINIGIMNLLPVPLLDGGRIMIDTIQFLTRNIISKNAIRSLEFVGIAFIGILFLLGFVGDIYRITISSL